MSREPRVNALVVAIQADLPVQPVSVILNKVLQLAHLMEDSVLEKWALLELNGYYAENRAMTPDVLIPEYRRATGDFFDRFRRRLEITDQKAAFIRQYPLRFPVAELERLSAQDDRISLQDPELVELVNRTFQVNIDRFSFPPSQIESILASLRTEITIRMSAIAAGKELPVRPEADTQQVDAAERPGSSVIEEDQSTATAALNRFGPRGGEILERVYSEYRDTGKGPGFPRLEVMYEQHRDTLHALLTFGYIRHDSVGTIVTKKALPFLSDFQQLKSDVSALANAIRAAYREDALAERAGTYHKLSVIADRAGVPRRRAQLAFTIVLADGGWRSSLGREEEGDITFQPASTCLAWQPLEGIFPKATGAGAVTKPRAGPSIPPSNHAPSIESGSQKPSRAQRKEPVDFLLVTALDDELDPIKATFSLAEVMSEVHETNQYYSGSLQNDQGRDYNLRAFAVGDKGSVECGIALEQALVRWRPKHVIMVGVAAAPPGGNRCLGSVLVASSVVDLTEAKVKGRKKHHQSRPTSCSKALIQRVRALVRRGASGEVHIGAVIAQPDVVKSARVRDELVSAARKATASDVIGIEMEGAGLACAIVRSPASKRADFMLVKGLVDFANILKNDQVRSTAKKNVAKFLFDLLKSGLIPGGSKKTK